MSSDRSIPLAEPDLRGNEEKYLSECIRTGWVSSAGPFVTRMETQIAALAESGHAVATASGTAALRLALEALGIGASKSVIVPDWTFAATVNAVIHAGATPVLVDVHPKHWSLDPGLLELELEAAHARGERVAAVIAVDPLGLPADFDALKPICARYGAALIEDAAGALGARYKGRAAGGLGDLGILSFNGNKIVTGGGGGAIITGRTYWAERARHLSAQARTGARYAYDAVGFNYRMTNLNAAVVVAQLERLDSMMTARRAVAARYTAALAGRDDLAPPPVPSWAEWNAWMYAVRAATPAEAERFAAYLQEEGISARPFWLGLAAQPVYARYRHRLAGVSASLSGSLVSLPCTSTLTAEQVSHVVDA